MGLDVTALELGWLQTVLGELDAHGSSSSIAKRGELYTRLIRNSSTIDVNGVIHFNEAAFTFDDLDLTGNVAFAGRMTATTNSSANVVTFIADTVSVNSNATFLKDVDFKGAKLGFSGALTNPDVYLYRLSAKSLAMDADGVGGALSNVTITAGRTTLTGNLAAAGVSTFTGNATFSGFANVAGTLQATGNATFGGFANVAGVSTLTGNVTMGGFANVASTLQVAGISTLTGNATLSGFANVAGTLQVSGTSLLVGNVSVSGFVNIASTLQVAGNTSIGLLANVTYPVVSTTINYTATANDDVILAANATAATVTLYTAVGNAGRKISVKNMGAGIITVKGNSTELIDANNNFFLTAQYESVVAVSNGNQWCVL